MQTHSSPGLYDSSVSTRAAGLARLQWKREKSVTAVVVAIVTLAVKVRLLVMQLVVVGLLVVEGKLVVVTVIVKPAALVLVVVVRTGRAVAIHPGYSYPLAQSTSSRVCFQACVHRCQS